MDGRKRAERIKHYEELFEYELDNAERALEVGSHQAAADAQSRAAAAGAILTALKTIAR